MSNNITAHVEGAHPDVVRRAPNPKSAHIFSYTTPDGNTPAEVTRDQYAKWVGKPVLAEKDLRQQAVTNSVLLSDVTTEERRILEFHGSVKKKLDGFRFDFKTWHDGALETLKRQQSGTKYAKEAHLSLPHLIERVKLSVPVEEVEDLARRFASSEPTADRYFNDVVHQLVTITDDPRRAGKLLEEAKKVTDANCNAELIKGARKLYEMSLTEPVDVASVVRLLQQSDGSLQDLHWQTQSLSEQRRVAIHEEENMVKGEAFHDEMLDHQHKIHKLYLERLNILNSSGLGEGFLEDLGSVCGALSALGEKMVNYDLGVLARVQKDLSLLDAAVRKEKQSRAENDLAFAQRQQERYTKLVDNAKKQDMTWCEVDRLLSSLLVLAQERGELVKQQIEDKTAADDGVAFSDKFYSVCNCHTRLLEEVQKYLEAEKDAVTAVEKFHVAVYSRLHEVVEAGRKATNQEVLTERNAFYNFFRGYVLNLGDLLCSKERLLESMDGQLEDLTWSIQHAKDSLDPNLRRYQEERRDAENHMQKVRAKVDSLKETIDAVVAEFEPTEKALFDAGVISVSPLVELHESMASRAEAHTTSRSELKQKALQKLQDLQSSVERVAESAKRARSARMIGSQALLPLSPSREKADGRPDTAAVVTKPMDLAAIATPGRIRKPSG